MSADPHHYVRTDFLLFRDPQLLTQAACKALPRVGGSTSSSASNLRSISEFCTPRQCWVVCTAISCLRFALVAQVLLCSGTLEFSLLNSPF